MDYVLLKSLIVIALVVMNVIMMLVSLFFKPVSRRQVIVKRYHLTIFVFFFTGIVFNILLVNWAYHVQAPTDQHFIHPALISLAGISSYVLAAGVMYILLSRTRDFWLLSNRLDESEKRFKALVENAPEGIIVIDADTDLITEVNPAIENLINQSADEIRRHKVTEFLPARQPDGQDSTQYLDQQLSMLALGEKKPFELSVMKHDGSIIPCQILMLTMEIDGRRSIRASVYPLSERKELVNELKKSWDYAENILNADPAAVAVVSADGMIMQVNQAWKDRAMDCDADVSVMIGVAQNYFTIAENQDKYCFTILPSDCRTLKAFLASEETVFTCEYDCRMGKAGRRYLLTAVRMSAFGSGIVINHTDVTITGRC